MRRGEMRERIAKLLKAGKSQAEVSRIVGRTPGAVALHARALGIAPKKYTTPLPVHRGKRRCVSCRKMKTLGAFPNDRQSECTVCVRAKSPGNGRV
jgi:hypothetical protein